MTAQTTENLRRSAVALVGEVDETELACRMLEAAQSIRRPAGATAAQALDSLDPASRAWIQRQARAAITYMAECLALGRKPQ